MSRVPEPKSLIIRPKPRTARPIVPNDPLRLWPPGGRLYGEPIDFRGLRHAPLNELGVLFLFGALAADLGFRIESLRSAFPDCEAKRLGANQAWERVRIEFEFMSRNFLQHGHDPKDCELIVCWEHNWPDCPLEVLELKRVVASRAGRIESRSEERRTS